MATLEEIPGMFEFIQESVRKGKSYSNIRIELEVQFPGVRGFSERSIARFCDTKDISRTSRLDKHQLKRAVSTTVREVCTRTKYLVYKNVK